MDAHYQEGRAALRSPSPALPCPLGALSPGGTERLHEMFITDVGLGTKLIMAKSGADFPGTGWSQTCLGSPGDLGCSRSSCPTGCGSVPRRTALTRLWQVPELSSV